ncbi:hypothetical protein [Actinokineospora sp.]|uniref:hypothetical protein n=1 Tax=Actinokineospora sp. TaxID=1872133 RepID=UPI0040380745
MRARITMTGGEISNRWPHIARYLRVDSTGWVDDDYLRWYFANERVSLPCVDVAAAYEEWADFYECRLEHRIDELAVDHRKRTLVACWTEDMTYCIRRCAAYARGEDPGEPVPMSVRRPDLEATHRAIVDEIIARLDADRQSPDAPGRYLRRAG